VAQTAMCRTVRNKQNMIDPLRAIRCVNFEASVSMFLVNGILPVYSFVWTFCVIGL